MVPQFGWTSSEILAVVVAALGATVGFLARERTARQPKIDLALVGPPTVTAGRFNQSGVG